MSTNSINTSIPIDITQGGTNASSMATDYGVLYYDGSKLSTVASVGTSGQVLSSNGSSAPTFKTISGGSGPSSAFSARLSAYLGQVTGDGTVYTIVFNTEDYDLGSDYNSGTGVFTAPSTDKYYLSHNILVGEWSTAYKSSWTLNLITSNRTYTTARGAVNAVDYVINGTVALADMDTSDTAYLSITAYEITNSKQKTIYHTFGASIARTNFCGYNLGI